MGQAAAQRISPRPGSSAEFSDYRTYVPGDDFRRVDWNAFARLDKVLLKLYMGEEDVSIYLWIDCSASMASGDPAKSVMVRRLAGCLSYIGLTGYDRVGVAGFAERLIAPPKTWRGRVNSQRLWETLASLPIGGETAYRSIQSAARSLRPGLSIVLSDFLTQSDPGPALTALRSAHQSVVLIQVLSPQELAPDISGDLTLKDSETDATLDVTVTPALIEAYHRALGEHSARLGAIARANGAILYQVSSDATIENTVFGDLRRIGLLK